MIGFVCEICGCETDSTPVCSDIECQIKYLINHRSVSEDEWVKLVKKNKNEGGLPNINI
jgi:hypothetical protein